MVQDCCQAVEMNPRYVKALFRRAKALEKLDNKKECLEGEIVFLLKMFCAASLRFSHMKTVSAESSLYIVQSCTQQEIVLVHIHMYWKYSGLDEVLRLNITCWRQDVMQ